MYCCMRPGIALWCRSRNRLFQKPGEISLVSVEDGEGRLTAGSI